jgi:hypothetical protein
MVLVRGLDRTDDNDALIDMPDDLWRQHVDEIQRDFMTLPQGTITFKDFCYRYFNGDSTTNAMRIWANLKNESK